MNSWDVRRARVGTIVSAVKALEHLTDKEILAVVERVAEDRYSRKTHRDNFIREVLLELRKGGLYENA